MNIIERLINLGYQPEEAQRLYNFYEEKGKLDDLAYYLEEKEKCQVYSC